MRKGLLFAAALCLASSAMAQTTIGTALTAKSGNNTYNVGVGQTKTLYWAFTADKDYMATVTPYGDSEHASVYFKGEDESLGTQLAWNLTSDWASRMYILEKGKTYIFEIPATGEATTGLAGFTLNLDETKNLGTGLTADAPVEIQLGETQTYGNPSYSPDSKNYTVYATYTAKEDGQLRIKTSQNVSKATVNGKDITAVYARGQRTFNIDTEAGKTYAINFNNVSIPFFTATTEVVKVTPGSIDAPFTLKEGENTVPAEAGKYYFTYSPSKKGYLHITSDAKLENGQVRLYLNNFSATSDNEDDIALGDHRPYAGSKIGSYELRAELASTSYTYYVVVDKPATSQAENFNLAMEDYQPGETAETAIPVDMSQAEASVTVPTANGTYYYSITVPANTNKFLVVKSATKLSRGSLVSLNVGTGTWGATQMENNLLKKDVSNTADKTYLLTVKSNEDSPLKLSFSYTDIEKGSLVSNPKEAVAGVNTIDFDGAEYYTYTATKDGKLAITIDGDVDVAFPVDPKESLFDMNDTYKKGNVYFISAKKGTQYYINLEGVTQGTTFTLAETEFDKGEVRSNPIEMTGDTYTFDENTSNLWLKYTATKTGIIDFSCDVPFGYGIIGIAKNKNDAVVSMADSDGSGNKAYQGIFPVEAGDELYIQVNIDDDIQGKKLTIVNRDPEVGEAMSNPIILESGQTVDISKASIMESIWIKAKLTQAKNVFILSGEDCEIQLSPRLESDKISYSGGLPQWEEVTLPDNTSAYGFTIEASTTPEDFYFRVVRADSQAKLTYDPTSTGISNIESTSDNKKSIYTINGQKVNQITGSGVYIIKSNGTAKKVVVKK